MRSPPEPSRCQHHALGPLELNKPLQALGAMPSSAKTKTKAKHPDFFVNYPASGTVIEQQKMD
jgi:hypothetical protein